MASSAKLTSHLPETLPENFNDWDLEDSSGSPATESAEISNPPSLAPNLPNLPNREIGQGNMMVSCAEFDDFFRDDNSISKLVEKLHRHKPDPQNPETLNGVPPLPEVQVRNKEAHAEVFTSAALHRGDSIPLSESSWKLKPAAKKILESKNWLLIACVSTLAIFLFLAFAVRWFSSGDRSVSTPGLPVSGVNNTEPKVNKPEQRATSAAPLKPASSKPQQAAINKQTGYDQTSHDQRNVQQSVANEPSAPPRISADIKNRRAESDPPPAGFSMASAEGLADTTTNRNIFGETPQSVVQGAPSKPVEVASGVAVGMLVKKTQPTYPELARVARVSGTVQLQAVISTSGEIKDLQILSGPALLRQAAVDAVRTWRYKPYLLHNRPTEVHTKINVVFSIGG